MITILHLVAITKSRTVLHHQYTQDSGLTTPRGANMSEPTLSDNVQQLTDFRVEVKRDMEHVNQELKNVKTA